MSVPLFGTHIVQITDTADDDARLKIASAYVKHTSNNDFFANLDITPGQNSIIIGTKASELFNNTERPDRLILALNYAPPDRKEGTKDNARNDFFCARLGDSGTFACGTSNGLEFSYLKPKITEFYRLTNTNSLGSQFRSLQILPKHAVLFSISERRDDLIRQGILKRIENVDDVVPAVPNLTHVLQVDNFGNVKLVPSKEDRALLEQVNGEKITFSFDAASIEVSSRTPTFGKEHSAIVAPTLFAAPLGTNVSALRSSSKLTGNEDVPIIATIRGRPAETLPNYELPQVGARVRLKPTKISALNS